MKIEIDREDDGRWIAEIIDLPGAMVYGQTKEEAISKAVNFKKVVALKQHFFHSLMYVSCSK